MTHRSFIASVALGASLLASMGCEKATPPAVAAEEGAPAPVADPDQVVARVAGQEVSLAELDAWAKEDFYKALVLERPASEQYQRRSEALDRLIDERVLEAVATQAGKTTQALLDEKVAALGAVSDAEVKSFFEKNRMQMSGRTLEEVTPDVRAYLTSMREDSVREELRKTGGAEILLPPPRVQVAATGPSKGPADAKVTIVEFSDYECPYCLRAEPTLEQLLEKYPKEVRLVYRHLPIDGHVRAMPASIATVCADRQGKFWQMHDLVFTNVRALQDADLERYAAQIGLDLAAFKTCSQDPATRTLVDTDKIDALSVGIQSTPTFVINGVIVPGALPLEKFVEVIDRELAAKN